ncbi:MAG: hypothetical protein R6U96_06320 [Promethearchaeia archaeon]
MSKRLELAAHTFDIPYKIMYDGGTAEGSPYYTYIMRKLRDEKGIIIYNDKGELTQKTMKILPKFIELYKKEIIKMLNDPPDYDSPTGFDKDF